MKKLLAAVAILAFVLIFARVGATDHKTVHDDPISVTYEWLDHTWTGWTRVY